MYIYIYIFGGRGQTNKCNELITPPRGPTVCKMIIKLKKKSEARAQGGCRASKRKKKNKTLK
jgi:hypothetical protein